MAASDMPAATFHLGGPPPRLTPRAHIVLALWLCRRLDSPSERFDVAVERVEQALAGWPDASENPLREISHGTRRRGAERVAQMAAGVAANALAGRTERAGSSLAAITRRVALVEEDPAAFLLSLDQHLMGLEAGPAVRRYGGEQLLVHRVVYRGDRGNGSAGVFVVQLTGGSYGAVVKLRGRYRWFSGELDDMIAHLPDAHLRTAAALGPIDGNARV